MLCLELGSQLLPIPVDVFSRQKERILPRSDADGVNEHVVFENAAHDDFVLSHKDGVSLLLHPDESTIQVIVIVLSAETLRTLQCRLHLFVHHNTRTLISIWECAKGVFEA